MTENPQPSADPQQQYWNAWLSLLQQGGDGALPGSWADALQRWWEAVSPGYRNADLPLVGKLLPQGQTYLVFGEQLKALHDALQGGDDWQAALQQGFDRLRDACFQPFQGQDAAHPGLAAFWGLPLDTWQRVVSSLSVFPGDALHALREEGFRPAGLREGLEKTLEMPALGYTREWQEQYQQAGRLWLNYQDAHNDYLRLLRQSARRALDLLQQRLTALGQEGKSLDSVRAVYDLWVDCNEEAYAELARSPDYSEVYGRMINALMRVKRHGQMLVNEALSALNVPNRRELDTTHARLQETRRRLRELTDEAGRDALERQLAELGRELAGLRDQVQALQAAAQKPAANRPARKRAARSQGE
ncbi:MAG: class III poly(R)-hydroxyalkanoic acid synthase subunit PhaE [Pseudomonadota bacterium]|nr:class III poly(R)-hydroxyalkanoic acid synthase subunit PhaE [Pseudomonadota bacterium]